MQYEEVKELIEIFEETDLNDMEVQLDNARIRLNRGTVSPWIAPPAMAAPVMASSAAPSAMTPSAAASPVVAASVSQSAVAEGMDAEAAAESFAGVSIQEPETDTKSIKAPIVGIFYQSSAPGEAPFVKVGDVIAKGDVVCIIEAMKFMNEVNSEVGGTVVEVLVEDGDFVEYGQELFRLQ